MERHLTGAIEDHMQMLNESAPEVFNVKHYVSVAELQVKSKPKG